MQTKFFVVPAVGWAVVSFAVPSTLFAQAEVTEPEPIQENCPCACNYGLYSQGNVCDIFDFIDFMEDFAAGGSCAINKDTSTGIDVGDIFDFLVFQQEFISQAQGGC